MKNEPSLAFNATREFDTWQQRTSTLEGYHKNYVLRKSPAGDLLNVDLNVFRKMVHLRLRFIDKKEQEYVAIIKEGKILQERENSTKKYINFSKYLAPFIGSFSKIPDPNILDIIGGHFGLALTSKFQKSYLLQKRDSKFIYNIWQNIKQYFQEKYENQKTKRERKSLLSRFLQRLLQETLDIAIGLSIVYFIFKSNSLSFDELALVSGSYAILISAFDLIWRRRTPFIPKAFLFIAIGGTLIYLQIQYRIWGMII